MKSKRTLERPETSVVEVKEEVKEVIKEKKKFIQCPFCGKKDDRIRNTDLTSSWCSNCGKCFSVVWKEE